MEVDVNDPLAVLWAKSNAGGKCCLLVQHLFDTAAVAELIWDHYFAPTLQEKINACCPAGRELFCLVCGLHDVGKATPSFQARVPHLANKVKSAGLTWEQLALEDRRWYHTLAGAVIIKEALRAAGWGGNRWSWIVPMISGHHGMVPDHGKYARIPAGHGTSSNWRQAQRRLIDAITEALSIDLAEVEPTATPSRAIQLAYSGGVIMADWIASSSQFVGIERFEDVGFDLARRRAADAWRHLGLRGGWRDRSRLAIPGLFQARFARPERAIQTATMALAKEMTSPGLLLIEAPMGEGKTEAALAAAEILAAHFGADGVFVGMPTQATSDAMFERVVKWANQVDPHTPPGLLHGKRRFNRLWHELRQQVKFNDICDEYGLSDNYRPSASSPSQTPATAPPEWFLGPKRGLLMPVTIGTIDHLLYAATRTRHVMLRHLGLVGRVVILDEVHAYDVYMMQFLCEALRWLGDAAVPVILLSATLPPSMRADLATAYLEGMLRESQVELPKEWKQAAGYPAVRSVAVVNGEVTAASRSSSSSRASIPVAVAILDEGPSDGPGKVVEAICEALADGGCALVVRNTVARAQDTYRALKSAFDADRGELLLLHAQLKMGDRVDRTNRVLDLLGPPDRPDAPPRPYRLVVVATQLAEQSFDVDVDLLVTDLAPIDLLLQRVGRLHRHERPANARPPAVAAARVIIAGMSADPTCPPQFPRGSELVYHRYPLLRAAALVFDAAKNGGWCIPNDVPAIVSEGYAEDAQMPFAWRDRVSEARVEWANDRAKRRAVAEQFILAGPNQLNHTDLAGLHSRHARDPEDDDVAAVVRDGPESVEVVMLHSIDGRRYTLDMKPLGVNDTGISDPAVAEAVMHSAVRMPLRLTDAAKKFLRPLIECGDDPWLRRVRVLEFDETGAAKLDRYRLTYDRELGLLYEEES